MTDFCVKRDKVANLISSVLTSLSRQKRKVQVAKLDTFAHNVPELSDISDFITSRQVEQYIDAASADAQSGGGRHPTGVYVPDCGRADAEVITKSFLYCRNFMMYTFV